MKKNIFLTIAYLCMANAYAAYLRNIPMTLNQPDGSVLHCFASGDEYFNYLHDRNGYTIMIHPQTGYYVYAENREGELVATNFIAGVHDPVSNGLEPYALISSEEWMAKRQAWEVPEMRSQNRDFTPNHGTLNNISIFIRFSDEGQFTNSYSSINNMFNNVSAGAVSMRSYFRAASYGAIEIPTTFYPGHNGETIISYQDIYPRNYFKPYNASTNTNGYQSDDERREREFALLERAVNYINSNYPVPSDLNVDCNDDGFVDNVCFIIRGGVGAWNSLLWPHQWELFDKEVYINGKRVWSFNFHLADATSYFNTSTMCHEMNHSLGAPDLYHYYYEKNLYQVGPWDLMHANATPPQHCGAYMKMKYGHWIDEIPEITEAGTYTLNPISSPTPTNVAYKILTDDPNQFYVLEYRDKSSMFETSLPGSGLLIYRINTSYHGNANYNPNEGIYDEVYLFRPGASTTANGSLNKAHHSSNVNRSEFSAATSAYPFFTNGTIDRSIRIYNITNAGNTISFTYGSMSDCEPPTNLIASIEDDDISLSWNAVGNASSYNIYKNGILIGSTSETTFLDSDLPYGSYAYYVKSVDSQGRRSVPSNAVTFVFDNYDISATAAPAEGGTVEGTGNYNSQTICTLEAMPNYGYIFVNWTENDSVVSTYDTLSFIVTKDRTFTANFQTIDTHWPMPQGYEDNMTITGTVNLDGVESTSDFIELAAFIGEECRGSTLPIKIGGQRVYFLTVAGNAADEGETLNFKLYDHLQQQELDYHCTNELNFQHDLALGLDELYEFNFVSRVQIMATADPEEGGTVSGEGTYYRFDTCSLTATAYTGYTFQNWTLNDEVVSTDTIYTFVVSDSANYVAHFSLNSYNITAITDPDEGGTVSGAGTYYHFDTCSLIATANIGYSFINWTLNDEVVFTDTIYTFVVSDSANYVAHFSLNSYDITAIVDPEEGGTVSGTGTYYHFDTCSLIATANIGYSFINWTLDDEVVSTDTIYTFMVSDSANYVAHFSLNSYDITAIVDPEEGGTVSGTGTYYHFDTCSLIATANIGYSFINWTLDDEVVSTDTIYTFMVSDSANYVAHFSLNSYDITAIADPEEGGTVSGTGTYYHFDTCSLIATANIGYSFINWTLDDEVVSTDTIYTFVVSDSANYVAHFSLNSYDITATIDPEEGGTVSGAGTYYHFDTCSLIATANIGYTFINWTLDDEVVSTDTIYTFVVSDSANYVAHFSLNRYDITVTADPEGSGRLSGAGIYYHFDTCTLTATTNMGYTFVNWTENGEVVSTDHTFSFEVTANRQLVANFNQITNHWTVVSGMSSSMTILGVIKIDGVEPFADYLEIGAFSGEECRGSALPQFIMGYCVYSLSVVGNANGDPITFRLYDHHHNKELDLLCTNVLAFADGEFYGSETFYEIDFLSRVQITTIADPAEGGTVEGGTVEGIGEYFFSLQAILTATANTGYTFQNWTLDEVEVTTESTYSFEVSDSANYVAHFSLNSYDVTVTADPDEGGTVTGAGTYTHGTLDTLTAMANMGYYFVNWTENGEEVSTDHTFSFEVTADRQLVANFNQMTNHWTAVSGMPGSMTILGIVKIDGEESFADYIEVGAFCGEECRGTALPQFNEGYCFYSMNVVGNTDGDTITFRLYDHHINQELDLHCTNMLIFTNGEFYDSEVFYEINFISRVQIAATADPTEGGTVEGTGGYFPGLQAILTATANTGYTFQNWTLDEVEVSIDTTYTFEVSDSANYVAHFSLNSYDITASADPDEGGSVNGTGTYYHYDTCTLIATAYTGYTFMNWTLNDEVVSTDTVYAFEVSDTANYVAHFNLNSYDITAIANPDEGGTVSGAGTYYHFDTCSLMATAYTGYTFQNWTLDDEVVSTDTVYTFVVSDSANYVAHFSLNSYDITAIADPDEGGIVSGKGTYYHFDTCTLIASANIGYTFVNWTLGEVEVSTESTYSFEVNGATDYVAHFSLNSYNITATVEPDESGTISGTGIYYHFDTCTLTATANTGYTFQHWTLNDEVISTEAEYTFEVSDSANYVAHFSLNSYNITATAEPDESGTISGAGIYYHFDTCTLTATANMGYTFQNWTLNDEVVSSDTLYTFVVSDTSNYVAHFNLNSYDITATVEPDEGGMISGAGIYYHFDTCTLTATAATGYTFQNWTLNDEVVSTDTVYAFEVSDSASYVAHFSLNSYDITATADPDEYGMVSGAGTYYHFDTCTLTATANIGYNLQNWTLNDDVVSTDTVYTFVVSDSANYVAHFSLNSYDITAISDPDEGGTLSGAGTYYHFDTCSLMATSNIGYTFINWTLDDEVVSTDTVYTFEVSDSASYVAHFSLNSYDITATADPEEGGTVSGVGTYYHFDTCSLIATANIGYTFINWTLDDEVVSTDAVYTFEVSGAATYVAHFSNSYEIVAVASPAEGGSVSGTGTYYHFDTCTLTATANMGYTFQNWTLNDEVVSTDTVYTFEVSGAAAYVANFSLNSYYITATADPDEGGTMSGAGTYYHFDTCSLMATANIGYTFINWTLDDEVVSTDTIYTFVVSDSVDYVAHFSLNSYEITATADPDEDGTVSGAGTYYHFDTCTLIATAYTGYTFMNWTLDDEIVSTDAEYTFEVSGAGDYVAHFSNSYEIVALASPVEGGIISGAGTYYHFDTCTLTATANENYLFNSWIVNGETVSTDTIFTFEVTGPMTVTALFYLVQTVELNQGWTWWSTSVEQSGINGLEMLENSLNPYGRVIKNADQFVQYNAILGWVGILNSLNNEAGYRVQTTEACTSSITGPVANPENHPITILPNWTWIGYPVLHQQTVTEALGNYEPQTNDLIKSQNSSARYIDNIGWIPANFSLKPGESYMYYSKALDNKTLVFANGGRGIVENKSDDRYWRNDVHAFADNLCLLAVVEIDGEEQRSEEVELGAFVNGECRGSAKLMHVEHFNRYYAMMNVMGEEGDEVKFALVDRQRNMMSGDSPAHLTFSVNAIVGEFDDPFVVCFGDLTSLDEQAMHLGMYPNPVKCNQTFCILVPQEETVAELTIVNTLGSVIRHETGALNRPVVEGLPVPGVYLVRVVCKSGNVYQNRLVVKQ